MKQKRYPLFLLDFDTYSSYREFPMRARFLARWVGFPLSLFQIRRRRTLRGWHVVVYLRDGLNWMPSPLEIVAAQAILGSDWKREGFNFVRARTLRDAPPSWQEAGRWNTLYWRKMGEITLAVGNQNPLPLSTDRDVSRTLLTRTEDDD